MTLLILRVCDECYTQGVERGSVSCVDRSGGFPIGDEVGADFCLGGGIDGLF